MPVFDCCLIDCFSIFLMFFWDYTLSTIESVQTHSSHSPYYSGLDKLGLLSDSFSALNVFIC